MKHITRLLLVPVTILSLALLTGACASGEKKAEGPESQAAAPKQEGKGTVEVQPSTDELARQQQEDQERGKEAELEKMKHEEGMKPARPGAPVETATTTTEAGGSFVVDLDRIFFDFDKFDITPQSRETLAKDAGVIKANPGVKVVIEGHCDERGTSEYNLALGERRASAAKKYLISLGVDESRLYTISYGEEKPADAGHNEAAWAKNRRVQYSQE